LIVGILIALFLQEEPDRATRAAMRRNIEPQTATAARTIDEASPAKQPPNAGLAELQKSLQPERERASKLEQDLATARRDVETQTALAVKIGEEASQLKKTADGAAASRKSLEQEHERASKLEQDLAAARRDVETQTALAAKAGEEASQLKRTADGAADLRKSLQQVAEKGSAEQRQSIQQEHDKAETLIEELSTAQTKIYAYEAQARQASDKAAELKQAAESGTADLQKSLEQERDRASKLEQDLAAARGDVETQTALAAKANAEAARLKQVADSDSTELKQSLQKEHDRAEALAQDVSMVHTTIYAYEAQTRMASDQTVSLKQAAESDAAELRKSLQQQQERAARLDQDLAAARRDVETQTALAAKANEQASQLKQAAETGSAELKQSLQRENDRAETLAQQLSSARTAMYAYEAQARQLSDQATNLKQVEDGTAELQKSLKQEQERRQQLEQELTAARRDVATQTELAAKANDEVSQLKQAAESGSTELKQSLQREHERVETLAQGLSTARTSIYAYEAQAHQASNQAADLKQAAESDAALRKSLQQDRDRAAQLEKDLAAAKRDVQTQTALAAKASDDATRAKQAAESGAAELRKSLEQERDRDARLERELAPERNKKDVLAVPTVPTVSGALQPKAAEPKVITPVATSEVTAVQTRGTQTNPGAAEELVRLVARASILLGRGDIGSARIVLERAAETGNAQASFALAETYDPLILRKWGVYGTRGDATRASDLYAKAQAGGIKEAQARLDALRR
jgi:septal ring factor EnvC (AmiA/AmiB activator)